MTLTQILLLILALLVVAMIAFKLGRASRAGSSPEPQVSPRSPVPSTPTVAQLPAAARGVQPRAATQAPASPSKPSAAQPSAAIRSWGYQLQNLAVQHAADSPYDLLVVDYAKDGSDESALTRAEVVRLQRKPDGQRRRVLAYLSIGEAESYRGYWQASWKKQKPDWLLAENPEWEENYAVCFWDPGWQAILWGSPSARLDRILAAGFDGVYLDKCDVYEDMRSRRMAAATSRPNLEADMIAFVQQLSAYAKTKQAGFLVVMQNAEALLDDPKLRRALDGSAKEELVFGVDGPEKRNGAEDFDYSRRQFDLMRADGKFVLVVEYLNSPAKIEEATRTIEPLGYTLFISNKDRELKKLPYQGAIV